ncbi:hypothetical protein Pyn_06594 [Prunus yedoensis var. nudiflora]|uniref:Uncharacterized protein n=1 Tax=Prunus yedoensis var. nudiflora TaxID=2094558 RepID=A0A314Y023_PRUYE|nr:hypothetical protein Pyn_06594 [Prunus yedoensis var. nudiflora]
MSSLADPPLVLVSLAAVVSLLAATVVPMLVTPITSHRSRGIVIRLLVSFLSPSSKIFSTSIPSKDVVLGRPTDGLDVNSLDCSACATSPLTRESTVVTKAR